MIYQFTIFSKNKNKFLNINNEIYKLNGLKFMTTTQKYSYSLFIIKMKIEMLC